MIQQVASFAALAALIVVVPGPDIALITRVGLAGGRRPALAVAAGTLIGVLFHGTIAAVGIAALIAASDVAFTALRVVGGAYLAYLGISGLVDAVRSLRATVAGGPAPERHVATASAFRQGVLSNALNPKVAVFFATFIPQFLRPDAAVVPQTVVLSVTFLAVAAVWHTTYALLVSRLRTLLGRRSVRCGLEIATGLVLTGLGVRLAVDLL